VAKADPWSVMKVSFLLSVAVGVIIVVASAVLWGVLDGLGVFDSLNSTLRDITGSGAGSGGASAFNLMDYIGFGNVMMFSFLISVVDVVLMTALATLSAFIYNTAAGMAGGIELTLAEEE
jgi:predicted membrane metal-binding protein